MSYSILLLILGFIFLLTCSDFMVRGASSLAHKMKVPPIFIGLIIIAVGTSVPELAISIKSSLLGQSGLIVGNILGSNITNILLFFGIGGLFAPFTTGTSLYKRKNGIFLVLVSALVCLFISSGKLDLYKGIVLLCIFLVFMVISYIYAKKLAVEYETTEEKIQNKNRSFFLALVLLIVGMIGITIGSELLVDGTIKLAQVLNVSNTVVGFSIISLGTSLPEIFVSVVALYRKEKSLALGNIIGSNIINLLVAFGTSAIIHPIDITENLTVYYILLILSSIFVLIVSLRQTKINRIIGLGFTILYIIFTVYNFGYHTNL